MYNNPREALARATENKENDPQGWSAFVSRCSAAHNNQLEGLPIFFAALLFALASGTSQKHIDSVALTYVISRVFYIYVYVTGVQKWKGPLRTVFWIIGLIANLYLLIVAATKAPAANY